MVKTPNFQCRGPYTLPSQRTKISHDPWHSQKNSHKIKGPCGRRVVKGEKQ